MTEGVGTCISIHAPTWGATLAQREALTKLLFQSTHPRGVRHGSLAMEIVPARFQSTHPRGVRLRIALRSFSDFPISIHAPTWGATGLSPPYKIKIIFQSTHPRGVRPSPAESGKRFLEFQSTHPRGVRLTNFGSRHVDFLFQSTHPRGVRPSQSYSSCVISLFQSTHPRGVRRLVIVV